MNRFFRDFCINWFVIGPLHYLPSRSDFGVEVAEIFVIEKRLPDLLSRGVNNWMFKRKLPICWEERRRLPDSFSPWVAESLTCWVGELSVSRGVDDLPTRGVGDSPTRWLSESMAEILFLNSPTQRVGKSLSSRLIEAGNRWLSDSVSWGVAIRFFFHLASICRSLNG